MNASVHARWVAEAARAPSPHNCQPARWRIGEQAIELHEAPDRWLATGDPAGRDNTIALGMAWEAMAIAMSRDGLGLSQPVLVPASYPPRTSMTRLRARGHVVAVAPADPLAGQQARRACHRGLFRACNEDEARRLDGCLERHRDVVFPVPQARVPQFAEADAAATRVLMSERAWVAELLAWLRLSPRHPRHARDGLSAACLHLSGVEARAASWLLRPGMATLLSRIGVAGLLLDDRRKVMSASACVLVCAPATMDDFTLGRRWYRFWLALTAAGFAGVPMSAPVDVPALRAHVESLVSLPVGVRVCNAMRIGPAPAEFASRSARLEAAELCL